MRGWAPGSVRRRTPDEASSALVVGTRSLCFRQRDRNRRTHARLRRNVQPPPMTQHDMLDDGEAEAGAADRAATARIDAVETLGEAGNMVGGDAFAFVDHA